MRPNFIALFVGVSVVLNGCGSNQSARKSSIRPCPLTRAQSANPKKGFVPDDKTAISIAVAAWSSTYPVPEIEDEKPYKAELQDGVWKVRSTLSKIKPATFSYATMSEADIDQENGCILRTSHPTFTF